MNMGSETTKSNLIPFVPKAPEGHHQFTVTSVAFLQEAGLVLSASTDGQIRLWEADSQKLPTKVLNAQAGPVWTVVAFKGNIISGTENGEIQIWNYTAGTPSAKVLQGHKAAICKLVTYESNIISASKDGKAMLWSLDGEEPIQTFSGHSKALTDAIVVGQKLVTGSLDHTVKVWDIPSAKLESTLEGHKLQITCLAAAGDFVASGSADGEIRLWNISTSNCERVVKAHTSSVTGLHKVLDNKLASTGWDGCAKVWDPLTGSCLHEMVPKASNNAGDSGICASGVALDGHLVACHFNRQVHVWDCNKGTLLQGKPLEKGFASAISVDDNGSAFLGMSFGEVCKIPELIK